jgi:hypothetical protein
MQLSASRPATIVAAPDPQAREASRLLMVDARDAVRSAVVATTNAGGIDPTRTFWMHRATTLIGRATGLVQAVEGFKRLSGVLIPGTMYVDVLENARVLVVDAAKLVGDANRSAALALLATANERLRSLDHQFAFDIAKHAPLPPA